MRQLDNPTPTNTLQAGDWPDKAVYALEYQHYDMQFPSAEHKHSRLSYFGKRVIYFNHPMEFEVWLEEDLDWRNGTDHDFTTTWSLYKWDGGPQFVLSN